MVQQYKNESSWHSFLSLCGLITERVVVCCDETMAQISPIIVWPWIAPNPQNPIIPNLQNKFLSLHNHYPSSAELASFRRSSSGRPWLEYSTQQDVQYKYLSERLGITAVVVPANIANEIFPLNWNSISYSFLSEDSCEGKDDATP